MGSRIALLICLGSTLFMTGLIWFVQAVYYPLFERVDPASFARYHAEHTRLTTRVVFAPMVLELVTSAVLVARPPGGVGRGLAWAGLATAVLAWGMTGGVLVPLHGRLAAGFDPAAHASLVRTNGARALVWSLHALIVLAMAGRAMR